MSTVSKARRAGQLHYKTVSYLGDGRFLSLGYQVREALQTQTRMLVEVGIGPGLLPALLREYGIRVITVDIEFSLRPSVVGALPKLPLATECSPVVACFETLEHLPLDKLAPSLAELSRVSSDYVLVSVPDIRRSLYGSIRGAWRALRTRDGEFFVRRRRPSGPFAYDKDHFWELGNGARPSTIVKNASQAGLRLVRSFRPPLHELHHFFVFRKCQP